MAKILTLFQNIEKLLTTETQFKSFLTKTEEKEKQANTVTVIAEQKSFLYKIFREVDAVATELKNDDALLLSVKNQKILRTCFQLIISLGFSRCLIPGLGINLSKRCLSANYLPTVNLSDEDKYEILTKCTDFFTRCYSVPVLKNIILTLHLSDYLAALIQLSFAPLKKPGSYGNFTMTQELYEKIMKDQDLYTKVYENLVANCFQPILMKELLVLQSVSDPFPPAFVKRVIAREMTRRLLSPGGLLSLIRCFIESYGMDTGFEWKKIDLICKIVAAKHGNNSEKEYVCNITSQLKQILSLKNIHYLSTAVACVLTLNEKYPQSEAVQVLVQENFQTLVYDELVLRPFLPGTIALSPQEVERAVNVLHACVCGNNLKRPVALLQPNLYLLFMIGLKSVKDEDMNMKLKDILLKILESLPKEEIGPQMIMLLFGKEKNEFANILIEEYEAGVILKFVSNAVEYPKKDSLLYFIKLYKASSNTKYVQAVFEVSLHIVIDLTEKRKLNMMDTFIGTPEDDPMLFDNSDERYLGILQLLTEICTYPKVIATLKEHPQGILNFIEYFLMKNFGNSDDDECVTIALVLLNTILECTSSEENFKSMFHNIIPVLKKMADNELGLNNMLCKEALVLMTSNKLQQPETACAKAISYIFDTLLPVRAHGIIELTKLIEVKDPETISKKHFIFCLFQEQLEDADSYIYLAAINGIASLASICTEDVLHVLCKEFVEILDHSSVSNEDQNKSTEMKMKIGDIIVKVTRKLGEMAVLHKTILLNTMLSGCRHEDPLIRTSALSNLAEIALVLHYRVGSIIYEILLCIWSTIETDPAIECRRAAVMVISSLLKGLGKETLLELKDNLLPIYRTLKDLYRDPDEDSVVRLHAQIALEELNDIVKQFLFPEVSMDKQIFVLDEPKTGEIKF